LQRSVETKVIVPIFTEVTGEIGTGHIMESFALVKVAQSQGISTELWINRDAPKGLINRAPCEPHLADVFSPANLSAAGKELKDQGARLAMTNFRHVTNDQIHALSECGLLVVCIDDFGTRQLDCDVVINPTMVEEQQRYTSDNPRFQLFSGPEYLTLGSDYQELHEKPRNFRGPVKNILVTLGGSDPNAATLKLVETLFGSPEDITVHVIVGAAFQELAALKSLLKHNQEERFQLHENVSNLASLMSDADIGFTAGGNTLSEMACIGTPAVVLFDEDHEGRQGSAFQKAGAAICLGQAAQVPPGDIIKTIEELNDSQLRESLSQAGKALVDGKGAERVLALLQEIS
jgi:spore coat polysaccharide biosynthesis predicted glycosyltransferase SpsG